MWVFRIKAFWNMQSDLSSWKGHGGCLRKKFYTASASVMKYSRLGGLNMYLCWEVRDQGAGRFPGERPLKHLDFSLCPQKAERETHDLI